MSWNRGNSQAPRHHARGVWLMLLSTAFFTANVLLIRALGTFEAVNVWLISLVRFVVGLAVLAAFYWHATQVRRVFTKPKLANRGILGGLAVAVYYITVVHLGAGRATFINNTYIIFAAVLAIWMLKERFRPSLATASIAAIVGLALLTNAFGHGTHASRYDVIAVLGAFASAYIVVTIRALHAEGENTATIFAAQCVYGLLLCAIPALWNPVPISAAAWAVMLVAGVCAAAGQLSMTAAFRLLPVGEGSLIQILVPLGIALGGYLFFHEHFAPHELLGAALIIGGTVFTVLKR